MSELQAFNKFIEKVNEDGEFPTVSNVIAEINAIVESDLEPASKLADWVMQDVSLTKKLLQLVNSVELCRYGGNISSISKAIHIVGYNKIKSLAMALVIINFVQNKSMYSIIKDTLSESFLSAIISSNLEKPVIYKGFEDLVMYNTFKKMGKLLTSYYFHDNFVKINELVSNGMNEDVASLKVLDISYSKISSKIVEYWNLPKDVLNVIDSSKSSIGELNDLKMSLKISSEAAAMIVSNKCTFKNTVDYMIKNYSSTIGFEKENLLNCLNSSFAQFKEKAASYSLNVESVYNEINLNNNEHVKNNLNNFDKVFAENILQLGTQEIFTLLTDDDATLSDIFNKSLDILSESLSLSNVCVFKANPKVGMIEKMYYRGDYKGELSFKMKSNNTNDLFQLSFDRKVDLVIENADAETIRDKMPDWFISKINDKSFFLLPLMIKDKSIGLIYGGVKEANYLKIDDGVSNLLKTIRNQMTLAIKQKLNV